MAPRVVLTAEQRHVLTGLTHDPATPGRVAQRARIVLLAARRRSLAAIAHDVGMSTSSVHTWLTRFLQDGVAGLVVLPRTGPQPLYDAAAREFIANVARRSPTAVGLPDAAWTLDLLRTYLRAQHGFTVSRSCLHELLRAGAINWDVPSAPAAGVDTSAIAAPIVLRRVSAAGRAPRRPRRANQGRAAAASGGAATLHTDLPARALEPNCDL